MPPVFSRCVQGAIVAGAALCFVLGLNALQLTASLSAERQARPDSVPGRFALTKEEWAGLATERVEARVFRPEEIADGNIAVDDDFTTPVFSPYSGRVVQVVAKLGDNVERGAPLFAVEATEFVQAANDLIAAIAALRTARAQLSQAEINEKRAHELYLAKGGALKDWQQSQTDLAAAQNTNRSAETALAAVRNRLRILDKSDKDIVALEAQPTQKLEPLTIVTAPIAGIVTQRQIGLGQYIQSVTTGASGPVYTIGDLSKVWLIANIREGDAGRMRIGQALEVTVSAYPGRIYNARLSWVSPSIDKDTRRLQARADVENLDGSLKPMMFARFKIVTGEASAAPAVPQSAIVYEGDSARVWVAREDRTVESRTVTTGQTSDGMVEIREGLSAGEIVVTRGTLFIDRAGGAG
ncbi:MAG TPA: efflux RND transporter periplasmic adaptor subunit [Stellaceae bacterium]|nr:efflux RND transporter periplasmic adaptor subunit [Stellaceae bacterium]